MDGLPNRITQRIDRTGECWLWRGCINTSGYGQVSWQGRTVSTHRLVYRLLVGPIPDGHTIDHLCGVKACVRPDHLEPVTSRTNTLRSGLAPATLNAVKTHCVNGHALTGHNLVMRSDGARGCRICRDAASRAYKLRKQVNY